MASIYESNEMEFAKIPQDIFSCIIEFLDVLALARAEQVCTIWRQSLVASLVWRLAYLAQCWTESSLSHPTVACNGPDTTWKTRFRSRFYLEKNWFDGQCAFRSLEHSSGVYALSFSNEYLAIGDEDSKIRVLNMETNGTLLQSLNGYESNVNGLYLQDRLLVSGSGDNAVRLWNWESGLCVRKFDGHRLWVNGVILSRNTMVSGSGDNTVKLWDTETGQCLRTFTGHTESVLAVKYQEERKLVLSGSKDRGFRVWDSGSGSCLFYFTDSRDTVWAIHSDEDKGLIAGSLDTNIRRYDLAAPKPLLFVNNCKAPVGGVYLNGHRIVSASDDGMIRIWYDDKCSQTIKKHSSWIYGFQCELARLVTGDDAGEIKIWDFQSSKKRSRDQSDSSPPLSEPPPNHN